MNSIRVFRYGLMVGWKEFARYWNPFTWSLGWMARVLGHVAFFALLGELLDSDERVRFILIGNSVVVGAMAANWAVPASTWDRGDGTYALLVVAPGSMLPAIIGRTSVWMTNGIASSLVAFLLLGFVFDIRLPWPESLILLLLIPLTCLSAFCLAIFLGSLITRLPRLRNVVHLNVTTMFMIICGVSVPVDYWPRAVEIFANLLPLTHGLEAIRLLLDKASAGSIAEAAGLEIVVALAWLLTAGLIMDRMADAGRRDGSIEYV